MSHLLPPKWQVRKTPSRPRSWADSSLFLAGWPSLLGRPNTFVARQPDLFVYLGDNIYGDTISMDDLRMKYAKLRHAQEEQGMCDWVRAREKDIGGSGGSLEPPCMASSYAPPYRLYGVV